MANNNISISNCQADIDNEIKHKFTPKKLSSEILAKSYFRIGYENKAERVGSCGTFLEFHSSSDDSWKLHTANFCRDRLCPMCSWRRSYKIFSHISRIMNVIQNDYVFLFLTLTVPNCSGESLSQTIDNLQTGFNRLFRYKRIKKSVKGFFKVLEVTRNKSLNTYHPHFHCILAVNNRYLKTTDYISHSEWLELWRKAMKNSSITQVDIRRIKSKHDISLGEQAVKTLSSAVAEVAKYSVKSSDYLGRMDKNGNIICPFPDSDIDEFVFIFSSALHHRRLTSFGGIFEEVYKKLQLDDIEDGDLVHVDSELRSDIGYMIRRYGWSSGAYKLLEVTENFDLDIEVE